MLKMMYLYILCIYLFHPQIHYYGCIQQFQSSTGYASCNTTAPGNTIWVGANPACPTNSSFIYTVTFSQPINSIKLSITAIGYGLGENITFNTDVGTPTITSTNNGIDNEDDDECATFIFHAAGLKDKNDALLYMIKKFDIAIDMEPLTERFKLKRDKLGRPPRYNNNNNNNNNNSNNDDSIDSIDDSQHNDNNASNDDHISL